MRRHDLDSAINAQRTFLGNLSIEIAEVKTEFAARRFMAELKKYDPSQPRAPRGTPTGGQWVDAGGGNSPRQSRTAPVIAAKPKVKPPTPMRPLSPLRAGTSATAAASRAVGLPLTAGVIGVSRAAGTFEHFTTGRSVTPILKIPFESSLSSKPPLRPPFRVVQPVNPSPDEDYEDELKKKCQEQYEKDIRQCHSNAAMYSRNKSERKRIMKICADTAFVRKEQCLRLGGPENIQKELFDGRR